MSIKHNHDISMTLVILYLEKMDAVRKYPYLLEWSTRKTWRKLCKNMAIALKFEVYPRFDKDDFERQSIEPVSFVMQKKKGGEPDGKRKISRMANAGRLAEN